VGQLSIGNKLIRYIFDPDVALDLGTANTRLYAVGKGLVCEEPTKFSTNDSNTQSRLSVQGKEIATDPETHMAPLRGGVVTDVEAAASLLIPIIRRARKFGLVPPRVLACAPTDASSCEVAALRTAVRCAGVSAVKIVPEPLAAAVGAGLDISSRYAQALIDIGDGVTDIAIVRSGELIRKAAIRLACGDLHPAVRRMVAYRYNLVISYGEAERLTKELGSVQVHAGAAKTSTAHGVDRLTGSDSCVSVSSEDVSKAIQPIIKVIMVTIRDAFQHLTPDIAAEVIENGICLTGGGACLTGMNELIASETGIEVKIADDPLHSVIDGASRMLLVGANTGFWHSKYPAAIY
jgi:rod shape-determining protein MreB and related proteins